MGNTNLKREEQELLEAYEAGEFQSDLDDERRGFIAKAAEDAFKKVMGDPIVKYTKEVYIKNKRMYVRLTSSVIREELSMGKSKIVNMVNEEIGRVVILDIVFV